jgi:cytochrome c-type biogenesis protein CcmH/NrfG
MNRYIPLLALVLLVLVAGGVFLARPSSNSAASGQAGSVAWSDPSLATVHSGIAPGTGAPSAQNVSHDFKTRLADLERRVSETPEDTASLAELGRIKLDAHDLPGAVASLREYLDLRPANHQAWLDLANGLAMQANWTDARGVLEDMLQVYPADGAAQYNIGAVLANKGAIDEALPWWHLAVAGNDPKAAESARTALARTTGKKAVKPMRTGG